MVAGRTTSRVETADQQITKARDNKPTTGRDKQPEFGLVQPLIFISYTSHVIQQPITSLTVA